MSATAKIVTLKECARIAAGHAVRGAVDDLPQGDTIMLQGRDVDPDLGIGWESATRIEPPGKRQPDFLRSGDILFSARGVRNFATLIGDLPSSALCSPHFFIIRPNQPRFIMPEYLAWFINRRPAQDYFQRSATGTNIMNIRREVVELLNVSVPSLAQQQSIVEYDLAARAERNILRGLIRNREQQMEALALGLAEGRGR